MKSKLFFILIFSAFSLLINAQNQYPKFPGDQHSYIGGDKEFFKDFHEILIKQNLNRVKIKMNILISLF